MCIASRERKALELYDQLVARGMSKRAAWRIAREWAKLPPDVLRKREGVSGSPTRDCGDL